MFRTNPTVLAVLATSFAALGPIAGMLEEPSSQEPRPVGDGTTTVVVSDAVHTEWRCADGRAALWVVGTVTVQNTGPHATDGLRLRGILEHESDAEGWSYDVSGLDLTPAPIAPGKTFEHPYAYATTGWPPSAEFRHSVAVLVANLPDGAPRQPSPSTGGRTAERPERVCPST